MTGMCSSREWIDIRPLTAILLALVFAATPAVAQHEGAADSLFRQGREEMKRGEPEVACSKFEKSYRLDPSIGTLLNLGLCEEARGHTATAWTKLMVFMDEAPEGDDRLRIAREHIATLETQLPWVRLIVAPSVAPVIVELDGIELRAASLSQAIPVDPGEHTVRVVRSSREFCDTQFQIRTAERLELPVPLPPMQSPPAPIAASSEQLPSSLGPRLERAPVVLPSHASTTNRRDTERAVAYGLGAVGVAGFVTGSVFGLMALNEK